MGDAGLDTGPKQTPDAGVDTGADTVKPITQGYNPADSSFVCKPSANLDNIKNDSVVMSNGAKDPSLKITNCSTGKDAPTAGVAFSGTINWNSAHNYCY